MSFLNDPEIADTRTAFNGVFNTALQSLQKADMFWEQAATTIPSSGRITQHNWLGVLPAMQEWKGARKISQVAAHGYSITNKKWQAAIKVERDDIDDDALGQYTPLIQSFPQRAMRHRWNLMVSFLVNGFATTEYGTGYDGLAFFSDSHASGDNKLAAALDETQYNNAWQLMLQQVDEGGEPFEVVPTHLVVGPKLRATARELIVAEVVGGDTNINAGSVELVVSPKLVGTYDDYWFLLCLSEAIKPLIFQTRRELAFRSVTGVEDDGVFMEDVLKFGVDARYNVGYGLHQMAVGSIV